MNWTMRNIFQLNLNQDKKISVSKINSNFIYQMAAIMLSFQPIYCLIISFQSDTANVFNE